MVYGGVTLPWEWSCENKIRNSLYPYYLSILLRIVDFLGLDYYFTVRNTYYLSHFLLVIIGDYYFYKVGCKVIGKNATRISIYFYISNKFFTSHLIRCFGNSVETILYIIMFNYYYEIKHRFDRNVFIFTFTMVLSFMIRCTSPIGFIPLVLYKIMR
jgi:hypothetical protein